MVINVAEGAPDAALADAVAPIAPDPFVPVVSTFEKLATVIIDTVGCESDAVTVTLVSFAAAKARQISLVPDRTFVRPTNAHVTPAPVTPVTVVFAPDR